MFPVTMISETIAVDYAQAPQGRRCDPQETTG